MPALALTGGGLALAEPAGTTRCIAHEEACSLLNSGNVLVCHASWLTRRLKARPRQQCLDILELFAFVCPASPCLPTPAGIARALGLAPPENAQEKASALMQAASILLARLARLAPVEQEQARTLASVLFKAGWRWAPQVLSVVGEA